MTELLGKTIGQFQIVEFTGESEDTLVYKGFQPSTNRYVMVKALKPSAVRDQARVDQFLRQAELVAQVQHPISCQSIILGGKKILFTRSHSMLRVEPWAVSYTHLTLPTTPYV